jgi:hypothetical protein
LDRDEGETGQGIGDLLRILICLSQRQGLAIVVPRHPELIQLVIHQPNIVEPQDSVVCGSKILSRFLRRLIHGESSVEISHFVIGPSQVAERSFSEPPVPHGLIFHIGRTEPVNGFVITFFPKVHATKVQEIAHFQIYVVLLAGELQTLAKEPPGAL